MFEHIERNFPMITSEEQEKLKNTTVAIAGVGGIGGWVSEALVRMGIGNFRIADLDEFEIHNLNRQNFSDVDSLGLSKVDVVVDNLKKINPHINVKTFKNGVQDYNIDEFLDGVDIVIDAVEYFEFKIRRLIQNKSREKGIITYLNVVAGFNIALFTFSPESISFDEYIGFGENSDENTFTMPFERTIPIFPTYMTKYLDPEILERILKREQPITNLCSAIATAAFLAANEVIINLLDRRPPVLVPLSLVLDAFNNKYHIADAVNNPTWTMAHIMKLGK